MATVLSVSMKDLDSSSDECVHKDIARKADDMDILIELIKAKMVLSSRKQKIQLLTIAPLLWRYQDIVN